MTKNQGRVVIDELANLLNTRERWRIDWLGDVFPQGPHNAQHMIDVFLSPLYPNVEGILVAPNAADVARQIRVPLGVGYLPLLYKGAIFHGGKRVPLRPNRVDLRRLKIAPAHSTLLGLQDNIPRFFGNQQDQWPILRSEYTLGRLAWSQRNPSKILAISDINQVDPYYVMIPCVEIARFFFCPSSVLARSAFSHGWDDLIWEPKCDTTKLPHEITVGMQTVRGLNIPDARHLAYKLISDRTTEALNAIQRSVQSTSQNRRSKEPLTCVFPFDDDTEIQAEVVAIPTGTSLKERYFVTRLLKCRRPLPFDICYAYPMMHPGQGENKDDKDLKPMSVGGKPQTSTEQKGDPKTQIVASNSKDLKKEGKLSDGQGAPAKGIQEVVIASEEDRFDGLSQITATLAPKARQEYKNSGEKKKVILIKANGMSTGTPKGSRPIISANIDTDAVEKSSDPTIKLLLAAAPFLQELRFTAMPLPVIGLAAYDTEPRTERAWVNISTVDSADGKPAFRSRLMVAIHIELPGVHCIVADIERKMGKKSTQPFGLAAFYLSPDADIENFLGDLATAVVQRKGWPVFDVRKKVFKLNQETRVVGLRGHHKKVNDGQKMAQKIKTRFLSLPLQPLR
jgi:hypothetical protein